jgi:hypothetical protein
VSDTDFVTRGFLSNRFLSTYQYNQPFEKGYSKFTIFSKAPTLRRKVVIQRRKVSKNDEALSPNRFAAFRHAVSIVVRDELSEICVAKAEYEMG